MSAAAAGGQESYATNARGELYLLPASGRPRAGRRGAPRGVRGFVGETPLHDCMLLAHLNAGGYEVVRRVVDTFPDLAAEEFVADSQLSESRLQRALQLLYAPPAETAHKRNRRNQHRRASIASARVTLGMGGVAGSNDARASRDMRVYCPPPGASSADSDTTSPPGRGGEASSAEEAAEQLPGLYTGQNILHMAVVNHQRDGDGDAGSLGMARFLLAHPRIPSLAKARMLTARVCLACPRRRAPDEGEGGHLHDSLSPSPFTVLPPSA